MGMAEGRACVEATVTVYSRPDSPWIQARQKKMRPFLFSRISGFSVPAELPSARWIKLARSP